MRARTIRRHARGLRRRLLIPLMALAILLPAPLAAQVMIDEPPPIFIDGARLDSLRVEMDVRDGAAVAQYRLDLSNPGVDLAEGRIVVPVPPGSAVSDLVLSGGPETLEGRILDASDAARIYEEIVRRLIDPALLQSISETLYEVRAFPVPPGEERSVSFLVTTPLTAEGDQVLVSVPWSRMSPRPAAAVVNIDVDVSWEVRAAVAPTYSLASLRDAEGGLSLSWESDEAWSPSNDFTLYLSGGEGLLSTRLLTYRPGDEAGYFSLLFAPETEPAARVDRDVILVLDVSGSMEGEKLAQAQDAARFILERLGEGDRYGVVSFSRGVTVFGEGLELAAEAEAGIAHVEDLLAGGGTNIAGALSAALDLAGGERATTIVFLTDGLATVGPEDAESILALAQAGAELRTQMFTFGVGFDVDTILLDALARDFLGSSHYVTPEERIDAEVGRLFERIATPVLTDVQVAFDGGGVFDLGPERLSGIFAGTQVLMTGRYERAGDATVMVTGNTAAGSESFRYDVRFPDRDFADPTVAQLWAQQRVADLLTELRIEGARDSLIAEIVTIATRFGIVTPFTSYLAEEPELAFSDEAAADAVEEEAQAAPASGEQAVESAGDVESLRDGDLQLGAELVRVVGDRSFVFSDGVWTETGYEGQEIAERLVGSEEFAQLLAADPGLAAVATMGPAVIARSGDAFFSIRWPAADEVTQVVLPAGVDSVAPVEDEDASTDDASTDEDASTDDEATDASEDADDASVDDDEADDQTADEDAADADAGSDDADAPEDQQAGPANVESGGEGGGLSTAAALGIAAALIGGLVALGAGLRLAGRRSR